MPTETLTDFYHPWCQTLFNSPHLIPQPTASREPPNPNPSNSYTLFSSSLWNDRGLRAVQSFLQPASSGCSSPSSREEWLVLHSLGTGLNGPKGIVHGGLLMTLLDSAMAVHAHRAYRCPVVTIRFTTRFLRKVRAPCVVLCRAWLESEENEGGRMWTRGVIEDGEGRVLLQGDAEFVRNEKKVRPKI
jgi:acyl-coenzyme A thioesterase THEM4